MTIKERTPQEDVWTQEKTDHDRKKKLFDGMFDIYAHTLPFELLHHL